MLSGKIVSGRFKLEGFLSEGGFGQVYVARCLQTNNQLAVKIEPLICKLQLILKEADCLQELDYFAKNQNNEHVPQFFGAGTTTDFRYMFMDLHGRNVRELKKATAFDRFSLTTSLWIGKQMLQAITFMHQNGWIHRDIKPPNFCLSISGRRRLVLVDFGTSEKSQSKMKCQGFCGTDRYASLRTHHRLVSHETDDLWSLYYISVENLNGHLPWRGAPTRDVIAQMKRPIQENAHIVHDIVPHPWFSVVAPPPSIKSMLYQLVYTTLHSTIFSYQSLVSEINRDLLLLNFNCEQSPLDWELPVSVDGMSSSFLQSNTSTDLQPFGSSYNSPPCNNNNNGFPMNRRQ